MRNNSMRNNSILGLCVAGLALAGCGGGETEPAPASQASAGAEQTGQGMGQGGMHGRHGSRGGMMGGEGGAMAMDHECPMNVDGADVSAEDVDGGVALVFTTAEPDQVEELRERVRGMAEMHQRRATSGAGGMGRGMMMHPPSSSTVVDIEGGARLEMRADAPDDVTALRQHVRMRAERMSQGTCPMMEAQQQASSPAHPRAG